MTWKQEPIFIVSWTDWNISCIDFHGLITLLCAKVNSLLYCPELSTVVAGCRETASTAIHSYPSMKETGRKGPRLYPPDPHPILPCHPLPLPPPRVCLITRSHMDAQCGVLIRPQGVATHRGLGWLQPLLCWEVDFCSQHKLGGWGRRWARRSHAQKKKKKEYFAGDADKLSSVCHRCGLRSAVLARCWQCIRARRRMVGGNETEVESCRINADKQRVHKQPADQSSSKHS